MKNNPASSALLDQPVDPRLSGVVLRGGAGTAPAGPTVPSDTKLCAMQWVSVLAGASNGQVTDAPDCACRVVRRFVIRCNDNWTAANRQKLLLVIPALLNTRVSTEVEIKRAYYFSDFAIRTVLPWLCDKLGRAAEGSQLRALTPVSDRATAELARQAARSLRGTFRGTFRGPAADAADDAAYNADAAAAAYNADAADAAAYNAAAAAYNAAAAAYNAAAAAAAADADASAAADYNAPARSELADLCIAAIRGALEIK